MACEQYKQDLTGAALGALEAPNMRALEAHLADCVPCRSALDQQRRLLAAIDSGVAASVSGEPSPEFAVLVRRRLAAEPLPARRWWAGIWPGRVWPSAWLPAAAGALAILAIVAVWLARRELPRPESGAGPQITKTDQTPPIAPPHRVAPSVEMAEEQPPAVTSGQRGSRKHAAFPVKHGAGAGAPRAEKLEVLVPPGEREAILRFYRAVWSGHADLASLVAPHASLEPELLKIAPLEVPALDADGKVSEADTEP